MAFFIFSTWFGSAFCFLRVFLFGKAKHKRKHRKLPRPTFSFRTLTTFTNITNLRDKLPPPPATYTKARNFGNFSRLLEKNFSGKRVRNESTIYFYFFTFGLYWRLCRWSGGVTRYTTCRSFFCMRLITKTCCECTRDARYKSEVKDSFPEKKIPKSRQKKTMSWDAFFNNDDARGLKSGTSTPRRMSLSKSSTISRFGSNAMVMLLRLLAKKWRFSRYTSRARAF